MAKARKIDYSFAFLKEDTIREKFWGLEQGVRYEVTGSGYDENNELVIRLKGMGEIRFQAKNFIVKLIQNTQTKGATNGKESNQKSSSKKINKEKSYKKRKHNN